MFENAKGMFKLEILQAIGEIALFSKGIVRFFG
jgi:hypothetical protein